MARSIGKSPVRRIDCGHPLEKIMNISSMFKRLIAGDRVVGSAVSLRNVIVWLFIVLVALFFTQPAGRPGSAFDAPVPWPPELGLSSTI
jgi:hypothetical protein